MEAFCHVSEEESTRIALEDFMVVGVDKLPDMRLSDWLKTELRRREWKPADFTRELKVSNPRVGTGTVSRWMAGRQPDTRYCELIADTLGVDPDFVLTLAGHRHEDFKVDPTSPEGRLTPLIRRVDWDSRPGRLEGMEAELRTMIRFDQGRTFTE